MNIYLVFSNAHWLLACFADEDSATRFKQAVEIEGWVHSLDIEERTLWHSQPPFPGYNK